MSLTKAQGELKDTELRLRQALVDGNMDSVETLEKKFDVELEKCDNLDRIQKKLDLRDQISPGQYVTNHGGYLTDEAKENAINAKVKNPDVYNRIKTKEYNAAMSTYCRQGDGDNLPNVKMQQLLMQAKAMTTLTGEDGGFLVSGDFNKNLIEESAANTEIKPLCDVVQTSSNPVKFTRVTGATGDKKNIYPNGVVVTYVNEVKGEDEGKTAVTFSTSDLPVHNVTAEIQLSTSLVNDNEFNITAQIPRWIGGAQAQDQDQQIIVGTGNGRPLGILKDKTVIDDLSLIVNAAAVSTIDIDDMINLLYALPKQYAVGPGNALIMNRGTVKHIRKLKDGNSQYLWQPSLQIGQPATFDGKRIFESEFMPPVVPVAGTTKSFPIIYGNMKNYKVAERKLMTLMVLRGGDLARKLLVSYLAHYRWGGQVMLKEAFRLLETSTV